MSRHVLRQLVRRVVKPHRRIHDPGTGQLSNSRREMGVRYAEFNNDQTPGRRPQPDPAESARHHAADLDQPSVHGRGTPWEAERGAADGFGGESMRIPDPGP